MITNMHFVNTSTVGIELLLEKIIFYFRKFASLHFYAKFLLISSHIKGNVLKLVRHYLQEIGVVMLT